MTATPDVIDLLQRLANAAGELLEHLDIADKKYRAELVTGLSLVLLEADEVLDVIRDAGAADRTLAFSWPAGADWPVAP